jgi:hypothetical protein
VELLKIGLLKSGRAVGLLKIGFNKKDVNNSEELLSI